MNILNTVTKIVFCSLLVVSTSTLAGRHHSNPHDSDRHTGFSHQQNTNEHSRHSSSRNKHQRHSPVIYSTNNHSDKHKYYGHANKHWNKRHQNQYYGHNKQHYSKHHNQPNRYAYNHYQQKHADYYRASQTINRTLRRINYYNPGLNLYWRF